MKSSFLTLCCVLSRTVMSKADSTCGQCHWEGTVGGPPWLPSCMGQARQYLWPSVIEMGQWGSPVAPIMHEPSQTPNKPSRLFGGPCQPSGLTSHHRTSILAPRPRWPSLFQDLVQDAMLKLAVMSPESSFWRFLILCFWWLWQIWGLLVRYFVGFSSWKFLHRSPVIALG